jgi:nucleoside-diphosphate-sugar epimerase
MKEKITIIGGGWIGIPLAESLYKEGFDLVMSSRKVDKQVFIKNKGWSPIGLEFTEAFVSINLLDNKSLKTDVLIIGLPPTGFVNYPAIISSLLASFPSKTQVIFLSSTSVYLDTIGLLNEASPRKINHPLVQAEEHVLKQKKYCVLRLGGLIGPGRHPINQLIKKEMPISDGETPVNLIHQADVIRAVSMVINQKITGETFNLCSPEHPTRKVYYNKAANHFYDKELSFIADGNGKIIDGSAIENWGGFCYNFSIYNFEQSK